MKVLIKREVGEVREARRINTEEMERGEEQRETQGGWVVAGSGERRRKKGTEVQGTGAAQAGRVC